MTVEEYQLCEKRGKEMIFPPTFPEIDILTTKMDPSDVLIVIKECLDNKTPAWFFTRDFEDMLPSRVVVLKKKTLSKDELNLLIEGYRESADEDLAIAKEFEQVENELDKECDK
jgi:hypothetical protein